MFDHQVEEDVPGTFYLQGNSSLLELKGTGFFSSTDPSQKGFDTVGTAPSGVQKN